MRRKTCRDRDLKRADGASWIDLYDHNGRAGMIGLLRYDVAGSPFGKLLGRGYNEPADGWGGYETKSGAGRERLVSCGKW